MALTLTWPSRACMAPSERIDMDIVQGLHYLLVLSKWKLSSHMTRIRTKILSLLWILS